MTADEHRPPAEHRASNLQSICAFRALLDGRLTIFDRFDRDGRAFLVAVQGASSVSPGRALTARERRAVALARTGHANKAIAAELGLSESRVSTLMRAVGEKLGARSRVDLVRLLVSLPDPGESDPDGAP
jgi:DNA-binding CsgD family transcriptional regulator